MHFGNWKIGARMGAGLGVLLVLVVFMCIIGISRLATINDAITEMVQGPLKKQEIGESWMLATSVNSVRTLALLRSDDAAVQAVFQQEINEQSAKINALQKQVEAGLSADEERQLFAAIGVARKNYVDTRQEIIGVKATGDVTTAATMTDAKFVPALNAYVGSVQALLTYYNALFAESDQRTNEDYADARNMLIGAGVFALVLGVLIGWRLTASITVPVGVALDVAERVAAGDLSSQSQIAQREDEVGRLLQALDKMRTNLANTVTQIRTGADTISTASTQITTGNLDLSSRTEEQASSLEETASSMEELTSTVRQNAENANQANRLAMAASDVAVKGGGVVSQVVDTMASITESSKKIADIISVIDGIAFQTNILALNAAVEAARAGEQGRGFAVVASEVRSLAQRSATAAKEIKDLIDDSVTKVDTGSRLVTDAGTTMREVVEGVRRVSDIVAEITAASQEQSAGIEQVNQAILQMDQVTQQNAALVEEAAAASESLQDQARALVDSVSVFKVSGTQAPLLAAPAKRLRLPA
jgi:methyl-accepting chemotaxis protein